MAEEETLKGETPSHGHTPVLALLRHFTNDTWRKFLQTNPWTLQVLTSMLDLVVAQTRYKFASPRIAAQTYCLTAKRWMGAIAQNADFADVEVIAAVIRSEKSLPRARGLPHDEPTTLSPGWHEQCARAIERLAAGRPVAKLKGATDRSTTNPDTQVFRPGRGKFAKTRVAKDVTDPFWHIIHYAWARTEKAIEERLTLKTAEARALLIVLFQSIYGIMEDDIQSIRIREDGGPFSIHPEKRKMILHLGSDYYPTGSCFRRSDLPLPLPSEIGFLLGASETVGSGRLLDLWTPGGWREAKAIVRAMAQASGYSDRPMEWSAHRIHREVAILHLKQSVTEVCLIEGRPILGFRGPCSYLSIPEDEAQRLFEATYHRTRELLGFTRRELPPVTTDSRILHGKNAATCRELVERLSVDINNPWTPHNHIMACIERLMRLLGLRRSAWHANPAQYARRFPEGMLLATDKMVGDSSFPHWVWLSPQLWGLIDALDSCLGLGQEFLPYMCGKRVVPSDQLRGKRRQQMLAIVEDEGFSRVARIAIRRALREMGAGDDVCCLILAHAPVCGPLDYERPDSLAMMCDASRHYLSRLYDECGINELALILTRKLKSRFNDRAGIRRPIIAPSTPLRFSPPQIREQALPLWTKAEDKWFSKLWDSVRKLSEFPENEKAQRTLLFVIIALECGIPPPYLLRYRGYYTLRDFRRSEIAKRTWLSATTGDCDKGGLSKHSIELGSDERSPLWRMVTQSLRVPRKGDRGCRRGIDWKLFEDITEKDIGLRVRKLLFEEATGSTMSNSEAFDLLKKCSVVRSRYLHPGYLAGVMSGVLRETLNYYAPLDVIKYRTNVSDLCFLDGTPVEESAETGARISKKDAPLGDKLEKIAEDPSLDEAAKAKAAWELIRLRRVGLPSKSWISKRFLVCQIGKFTPRRDAARAARITRSILRHAEESSGLNLSKGLILPAPYEWSGFVQLKGYLQRCRPKKPAPEEQALIKRRIYTLGSECLSLISCFALRTNEAIRLISQRNSVGKQAFLWLGDSLWCVVSGTKNKNAKRVARSFFCPWPSILRELRTSLSADCSTVMHHTKDRLKNAAEHIDISLHQIRHWSAIATVDQIIAEHYLTGNALLLLESYARNIGHGSLAMTLQSYVGTAMTAFSPWNSNKLILFRTTA